MLVVDLRHYSAEDQKIKKKKSQKVSKRSFSYILGIGTF